MNPELYEAVMDALFAKGAQVMGSDSEIRRFPMFCACFWAKAKKIPEKRLKGRMRGLWNATSMI